MTIVTIIIARNSLINVAREKHKSEAICRFYIRSMVVIYRYSLWGWGGVVLVCSGLTLTIDVSRFLYIRGIVEKTLPCNAVVKRTKGVELRFRNSCKDVYD